MIFNKLRNKLKPISLGVNLPCFIRLKSNNVYSKNKTKLTIVITIWNIELRINKPTRLAIISAINVTNKYLPKLEASLMTKIPQYSKYNERYNG